MGIKVKGLGLLCVVSLLSVSGLAAPANVDTRLAEAAKEGDKVAVRSLLKQHAAVNTPEPDGATALTWAAYRNDLDIADLLIGAGANVKATNDYGVTPLSLACTNGSAFMVERLLKAGAEVTDAVFMECVRTGNVEAVKSLLDRGANVNAREPRMQQTALMWAAAGKHPRVVTALIERGADVNARSEDGFTSLMFAAQQGDLETAQMLLATKADVNAASNGEADTALLVATASGHEALAIFLLDKGANPNAADKNGFTALHLSLMKGLMLINRSRLRSWTNHLARPSMTELVKALLAHGANPNARIQKWADKMVPIGGDAYGFPGSVSPVGATPFLVAAQSYDANVMHILAAGGADPMLATEENVTPLMVAAGVNRWRTAGITLSEEAEARALEAVKLAVELGNDVNAADYQGLTALHGAAFNGSNKIIQFLVEKGANLDAKDISGQTPLHKAANIEPPGTVSRNLISRGIAPKSTVDLLLKLGATPVTASVAQGSEAGAATAGK